MRKIVQIVKKRKCYNSSSQTFKEILNLKCLSVWKDYENTFIYFMACYSPCWTTLLIA